MCRLTTLCTVLYYWNIFGWLIFGYNQIIWLFSIVPVMVLSVAEYLYVVIIFTFFFLANQKFVVLNFMKFFYKLFMVIVHWLDLKMIFLKWVFFNLRIWLIFKETHWRDLHHFHSVLIDFITTSEKKTLDGSLDLEIQNPKLQTTYQANIQYRPKFSMIKLLKGSNFSKSYHFIIACLYNQRI